MRKVNLLLTAICAAILTCSCAAEKASVADPEVIGDAINYDVCKIGSPITLEEGFESRWNVEDAEIMPIIASIIQELEIQDGTLQKEAIIRINQYLCDNLTYMKNTDMNTISDALIYKRGCCASFALAFECLAQYCGIDAGYISGWVYTGRHAWNSVRFSDGSYCELDVTWNRDNKKDQQKYLFRTKTEMKELHFLCEGQ